MTQRPTGFLQVDVDGLWAVRACYGKPEGDSFEVDPCWSEGVPALSQTFSRAGVPGSFFIVGRDLELRSKRRLAKQLLADGHELANHSYRHIIGLTSRPLGVVLKEMRRTDAALRHIGASPKGFRSPGYDIDARVLRAVSMMGYLYDASLLPTPWSPALRVADALLGRRLPGGKRQFGRLAYARAPRHPYFPIRHRIRKPAANTTDFKVLEIPVGVTPRLRLPLTGSTLLGMSRPRLRELFNRLAQPGLPVLLLLHAIDGTDCSRPIVFDDRRPRLAGFHLSGTEKQKALRRITEEFARSFHVVRADEYAQQMHGNAR